MAEPAKKLWRIEISERLCKGCGICADFCPTNVLEMKGTIVGVVNLEAKGYERLKEIENPDFAIQVFPR